MDLYHIEGEAGSRSCFRTLALLPLILCPIWLLSSWTIHHTVKFACLVPWNIVLCLNLCILFNVTLTVFGIDHIRFATTGTFIIIFITELGWNKQLYTYICHIHISDIWNSVHVLIYPRFYLGQSEWSLCLLLFQYYVIN
jgi:hypothetical protein